LKPTGGSAIVPHMKLRELLATRREDILRRFVDDVRESDIGTATIAPPLLLDGLPNFLDHVIGALGDPSPTLTTDAARSGPAATARDHGLQRWELGYDVRELVREYGILRDVILGLLMESGESIDMAEYRVLSRYISQGVAEAVGRFSEERDGELTRRAAEEFAFLAHELRNPLTVALLCLPSCRENPDRFPEVAVLEEALSQVLQLLDGSIRSEQRKSGQSAANLLDRQTLAVSDLMANAARETVPVAKLRGVRIVIEPGDPIEIRGDARFLRSALGNLVRNAVKFTHKGTTVTLRARREETRVLLEIEDECGGLPPGALEKAFEPFVQLGEDQSGFGLGLAIAREAAQVHGGDVSAVDLAGRGCCFTLELPIG
jgi:signal transduction histidine kinase